MIEITGEVDYKELGQMQPPGFIRPSQREFRYIPILKLRVLTSDNRIVQVLFKGEVLGDADTGDQVTIKGVDRGGVIHAFNIFNNTTNSWVTHPPALLNRLLKKLFS